MAEQYRSMNGIVLLTSHDENEILSCDLLSDYEAGEAHRAHGRRFDHRGNQKRNHNTG